ncbi:hypothetical protein [Peptostreptococcus porci]|uniref:hypothetical protein n=1 Tax=Peptostreptococcus porci TaxID=2652282 RepID=UPI002A90EEF6|nr:hypothetical protein [Peptostreptococcus porci]MDY5436392.1 hypothetical protein [Peptostreptococcus porci]
MSFDALFAKWKATYNFYAFIRDGIVDPEYYEKPHILFILRDMNCQTERNLCDDLANDGSGWKTWNNVGKWTKALLDGDLEYPKKMSTEERVKQLRRIAVMNLKKEGGVSRTAGKELMEAVQAQHEMIYEEICLCDPSIIICCGLTSPGITGNATLLKDYVLPLSTEWMSFRSEVFNRDWWYYFTEINEKQIPVINFCHPQVTNLENLRGHDLFEPLYRDMLHIRKLFLKNASEGDQKNDEI